MQGVIITVYIKFIKLLSSYFLIVDRTTGQSKHKAKTLIVVINSNYRIKTRSAGIYNWVKINGRSNNNFCVKKK